jgi:monoamine oxidase
MSSTSSTNSEVLIIGAGAAGLVAARDLTRAGVKVLIVESRSRIGGRIFTHHDPNEHLPIELGAEFMHGKSPELFSIIKDAGLKFEEVTSRHWYFENGRVIKSSDFWSTLEHSMEGMKNEIKDQSLASYFESTNSPTPARNVVSGYVEGFHAAQIDKIGIHGLTAFNEASDLIEGDRVFRLLDGYDGIVRALHDDAVNRGASVRLNTTVVELRWSHNNVQALCDFENDTLLVARKSLITVPIPILKSGGINFVPGLPGAKLDAIRSLEMGAALRIVLRFTHLFWENLEIPEIDKSDLKNLGFIHCPDATLPTWWTTLPEHEPILVGWAGGPRAKRLLSSEDDMETRALESLSLIFSINHNVLQSYLVKSYFHNWQSDAFSRGAYSYLPVNGIEHQLNLAKPVDGTLFFAGEATSHGHIGTVHGAIQSGTRAAREILTALK